MLPIAIKNNMGKKLRILDQPGNDPTDRVTGHDLISVSSGIAFDTDWDTFLTRSFSQYEAHLTENGITAMDEFQQIYPNPNDLSKIWIRNDNIQPNPLGESLGDMDLIEYICRSWHSDLFLYDTTEENGDPDFTGRVYFNFIYKAGVSEANASDAYFIFEDFTANLETEIRGLFSTPTVTSNDESANIVVTDSSYDAETGVRILKGNFLFNNLTNDIRIQLHFPSDPKAMILAGFDMSYSPLIHNTRITNQPLLGKEIVTDDWTFSTGGSYSAGQLTIATPDGSTPGWAELPLTNKFYSGEKYFIEFDVVSSSGVYTTGLDLIGDNYGFIGTSPNTIIISSRVGHNSWIADCNVQDGRLRFQARGWTTGQIVLENISCRKIIKNPRTMHTTKGKTYNYYGDLLGDEIVQNGDMEAGDVLNYGTPLQNWWNTDYKHSGTQSREIQNSTSPGNSGLYLNCNSVTANTRYKLVVWVYALDDIDNLVLAMRNGTDTDWSLVRQVGGVNIMPNTWTKLTTYFTEVPGGSDNYLAIYVNGSNEFIFFIDDVSCKSAEEVALNEAFPLLSKAGKSGTCSFTWTSSKSWVGVIGSLFDIGDLELGYTGGGVLLNDGTNVASCPAVAWAADQENTVRFSYGLHAETGVTKMRLKVNDVVSDLTTFTGDFNFGLNLAWMFNDDGTDNYNCIKDLEWTALSQEDWNLF